MSGVLGPGPGRRPGVRHPRCRHRHATVIATLPPEHVGRQVAERVGLDHAEVTRAVTDAVSRGADALGRVGRRDLRGDLDRGWETPAPSPGGTAGPSQLYR